MANFDVTVRRSYRDVGGLILDCAPGGIQSIDGKVNRWLNEAPKLRAPRFGDPFMDVEATRPLAPGGVVRFVRADLTQLKVPLVGDFGAASQDWAFAFSLVKRGSAGSQVVFASQDDSFIVYRRKPSFLAYTHSGGTVLGAAEAADAEHLITPNDGATLDWAEDNVLAINDGAFSNISFPADQDNSLLIGNDDTGVDALDADLASMRIWNRILSPRERDFVYQTIGAAPLMLANRLRMFRDAQAWTDGTGDESIGQHDRLNPLIGRQHRFHLGFREPGAIVTTGPLLVQVACEVGGVVLPDSGLGGDLFTMDRIETPNGLIPSINQDAGWSAVFDIGIPQDTSAIGHYSMIARRANGGAKIIKFDVRDEIA